MNRVTMGIIASFFDFLLNWYVWLPIVLVLAFLTWKNNKSTGPQSKIFDGDLLILEIPRTNDKSELAAEQLFASLHGILRDAEELKLSHDVQEHLGFEIASINGQIRFYAWVPKALRSFVEGQIYSQYPSVQIPNVLGRRAIILIPRRHVECHEDLQIIAQRRVLTCRWCVEFPKLINRHQKSWTVVRLIYYFSKLKMPEREQLVAIRTSLVKSRKMMRLCPWLLYSLSHCRDNLAMFN
jgi:hypothetical protein